MCGFYKVTHDSICSSPTPPSPQYLLPPASQGGKVVDRVNGAHVPELTKKTAAHSQLVAPPPPAASQATPTEVTVMYVHTHTFNMNYTGHKREVEKTDKLCQVYSVHEGNSTRTSMWWGTISVSTPLCHIPDSPSQGSVGRW